MSTRFCSSPFRILVAYRSLFFLIVYAYYFSLLFCLYCVMCIVYVHRLSFGRPLQVLQTRPPEHQAEGGGSTEQHAQDGKEKSHTRPDDMAKVNHKYHRLAEYHFVARYIPVHRFHICRSYVVWLG